jgi:endoglucanase
MQFRTISMVPVFLSTAIANAADANPKGVWNLAGIDPATSFSVVLPAQLDGNPRTGTWQILSDKGTVGATGTIPASKSWSPAGESVQLLSIPGLPEGTWTLKSGADVLASNLVVRGKSTEAVFKAAAKAFYYQRASTELLATHAGKWARPAGHPDTWAKYHPDLGKGSGGIASPKGWYDAGDYNKYIVNSGFAVWTLLNLAERFPVFVDSATWNIPESRNTIGDLLDEVKWNLDWMLTMQESSGAVFFKLTSLDFCGTVMPAQDNAPRFVVGYSTAASLDFAATMAVAARLYKKHDATYAAKCLKASEDAFAWAKANPNVAFTNPSDVKTGEYGDKSFADEFFLAAAELALTKNDYSVFQPYAAGASTMNNLPWWGNPGMFGLYTIVANPGFFAADTQAAKKVILDVAANLKKRLLGYGYGVASGPNDFSWGSNSSVAQQGFHVLQAWFLTRDSVYLKGARFHLDYLLGMNPLGTSYVTGTASKSPMHPHHRPSQADNQADPVPGFVVGGPTNDGADIGPISWQCTDYRSDKGVALSWYDNECSYATNEIAINWNAVLVALSGELSAVDLGMNPSGIKSPVGVHSGRKFAPGLARLRSQGSVLVVAAGEAVRISLREPSGKEVWSSQVPASASDRIVGLPIARGIQLVVLQTPSVQTILPRLVP